MSSDQRDASNAGHAVMVVEEQVQFTLVELSRACGADRELLVALVEEGVLTPIAAQQPQQPQDWRFGDSSLRRAYTALRLTRDLELNLAGAALVLDLLEQLDALRSHLYRLGAH
jgi:chaperone modulatory protein CbpM